MEKYISIAGYWLGVISTLLALVSRILIAVDVNPPHIGSAGGISISYVSFMHGAVVFFLLSIASSCRLAKN